MIEFKRDKETGELLVYKNGELIGKVTSTGDAPSEQINTGFNEVLPERKKNSDKRR